MQEEYLKQIHETAEYLQKKVAEAGKTMPSKAVILGSGLGRLGDNIENPLIIPYSTIPNFPVSTAVGHKSRLIIGTLAGTPLMAMQGRFHYYEGYTMQQVTFAVRVFALLGIKQLFVSNAAGAVNPEYKVGDLMLITDHINMLPNPLIGPNMEEFGTRFPDMTETYSPMLQRKAEMSARVLGIVLQHGVYLGHSGPTYETPAEYKMYRLMGADAVGMSTTAEVIVARHCDIEVLGISVITNQANDLGGGVVNDGQDVVEQADRAATNMIALFTEIMK